MLHAVDTRMTTRLPCPIPSSAGRTPDIRWTDALVPSWRIIVGEFEPFVVLARQSDGTIIHFIAVFVVDLQLCVRAEIMKALANNREMIFLFLFSVSKYCSFINFSYYTYRSQKYFLLSFPLICDFTRRDRFFIHAKFLMLSWILFAWIL